MIWNTISSPTELEAIVDRSFQKPQVIFKHSTRCSISSMAKNRLEKATSNGQMEFHLLDLIAHRSLSNQIAEDLKVFHESPQVLLLVKGECVYDESHSAIRMADLEEAILSLP